MSFPSTSTTSKFVLVILLTISIGWMIVLQWAKKEARLGLTKGTIFLLDAPPEIEGIRIGTFSSDIDQFAVPNYYQSTTVPDSIELKMVQANYKPWRLLGQPAVIDTLTFQGITLHWDGLLGRNITHLMQQLHESVPRKARKREVLQGPKTLQINEIVLLDTQVVFHIGKTTKVLSIPQLTLRNVEGETESILRQILEQIHFQSQQNLSTINQQP